jgi:hypothetical protein
MWHTYPWGQRADWSAIEFRVNEHHQHNCLRQSDKTPVVECSFIKKHSTNSRTPKSYLPHPITWSALQGRQMRLSSILTIWTRGWPRGSVLAFRTQVCGFKPGWSRQIFQGEKILSTPSFRKEVKLWVPRRRFMACKRSWMLHGSRASSG